MPRRPMPTEEEPIEIAIIEKPGRGPVRSIIDRLREYRAAYRRGYPVSNAIIEKTGDNRPRKPSAAKEICDDEAPGAFPCDARRDCGDGAGARRALAFRR